MKTTAPYRHATGIPIGISTGTHVLLVEAESLTALPSPATLANQHAHALDFEYTPVAQLRVRTEWVELAVVGAKSPTLAWYSLATGKKIAPARGATYADAMNSVIQRWARAS